ncbi:hypothetical protein H4S01_003912 [Coemansia sp. RSA 2610]|nr:hypothetical protein H4S01_003912 [Coemansia sp. RSA 2610]
MSFTALAYIIALIMAGVLLFGAVYFYVMPEMAAQMFMFVVFLLMGEWFSMLVNLPLVAWNINKVVNSRQFYDATEVFRTLSKHKQENFFKVAFYLLCFFYYLYSMIMTLVNESTDDIRTGSAY